MSEILKKPKLEVGAEPVPDPEPEPVVDDEENSKREFDKEQKEALTALADHRSKEVDHIKQKISYYKSQLEEAERRLNDTLSKLARLESNENSIGSKKNVGDYRKNVKVERRSPSPVCVRENHSRPQTQSKPQLVIPAVNPKAAQPAKLAESNSRGSVDLGSRASGSFPTHSNGAGKVKRERESPYKSSAELEVVEVQAKGAKRKFEQKEHMELIPLIRSGATPCLVRCEPGVHISSQHKRKLRSLVLCPTNDQLFVTSALDGVVNFWQVQGRGASASLLSSTECASTKQRRWPEDIAWHPQGDSLFCAYTADAGDSQISILNLNASQRGKRVTFLEEKPHLKGIINSISFMPWGDSCFMTGGSDHAVVLWNVNDGGNSWKSKAVHRNMHSSAVMGVAGLQQKKIVMSVGQDKRIIGYDLMVGRADYKHQLETKCLSVVPNPSDFNLFMVQTGAHEKQLRLFDIRLRQTEIHAFGWKQESSESQSALINQAWSPDGLYLTSGSADPIIHIFDIRYNSHKPSQSIKAHQKRVFKAVWLHSLPLLVSISSDLQIGLHKVA